MKVAITGMGILSAIGDTVQENYEALVHSRKGITRVENIATVHAGDIMVGEIKQSNDQLAAQLQLPQDHNYTRTALLGALAARQAVAHAIRRELGLLHKDAERLAARVGNLDRHFAQAQKDVEEIRISAGRVQSRSRRLEAVEFAGDEADDAASGLPPLRLAGDG